MFRNDKQTVWAYMVKICHAHERWVYNKPAQRATYGRMADELLFDQYIGPSKVGNMMTAAETKLASTLYNGEKKRFTWEMYVWIHMEQHAILNGLKEYGYT
jgi:hypothetical protein